MWIHFRCIWCLDIEVRMRWIMGCSLVMAVAGLAAGAMDQPNPGPATQPTTMAGTTGPTTSVSGTVDYQGGLSLRKPDLTRVVVYLASDARLDALPVQSEPYV